MDPPSAPLPLGCTSARLYANLAALERRQPDLAERICLPVEGQHIEVAANGDARYRIGRTAFPLDLDQPALEEASAAVRKEHPKRVLLFGLGLGELLEHLLARLPGTTRIVAWERDPWLLRLALMRRDFTRPLLSGRLRLSLLSDLVPLAHELGGTSIVEHPFLTQVYRVERDLLEHGPGPSRALVRQGGLYVDSLVDALRRRGYTVLGFDATRVALEELQLLARRFRPALAASVNYTSGLAEFCHAHDMRLLCWEIDPATAAPRPADVETGHVRLFTYREALVPAWRRAGFHHTEYLPLAADATRRAPPALPADQLRSYEAPLAFVGNSLVDNCGPFRALFADAFASWRGADARGEGLALLDEILADQRGNLSRFCVPASLAARCPEFRPWCLDAGQPHDPCMLAGEIAAAERRRSWLERLAPLGLDVWGDAGWREAEAAGVRYRGPAGHGREINAIYAGARVNIDVGRLYQGDMITLRVFDILACGGFALVEHSAALARAFALGEELESYRSPDELVAKARHFLAHPEEARAIAARGRAAVLDRHEFDDRITTMLAAFEETPARRAG